MLLSYNSKIDLFIAQEHFLQYRRVKLDDILVKEEKTATEMKLCYLY